MTVRAAESIREIAVVIPARNEEDLLPRCLSSVAMACHQLASEAPEIRVTVNVVLDSCDDGSAELVRALPWLRGIDADAGSAGAARARGVAEALGRSKFRPEAIWIANTDADSAVPANWLLHQLDLARRHVLLMVGTVIPDPAELDPARLAGWLAAHELADGHRHVFGANLGLRGDLYLELGGFADLPHGEDAALLARAKAAGAHWKASDGCRVLTSGRLRGRARGGLADYLSAESA